jgi:hypothetical protein
MRDRQFESCAFVRSFRFDGAGKMRGRMAASLACFGKKGVDSVQRGDGLTAIVASA